MLIKRIYYLKAIRRLHYDICLEAHPAPAECPGRVLPLNHAASA
jgi:hypothetical protein